MIANIFKIFLLISILSIVACKRSNRDNKPIEEYIPPVQLAIENEPYFKYAWHFNHNENFASNNNINPDANIHIKEAWEITKGEDIIVAVIDAGAFDAYHKDLTTNVIDIYNADYDNDNIKASYDETYHGTTVAGFISSPINGEGLVGAAPKAKLILIKQSQESDSATIRAFKYARDNGANIINCSWGTYDVSQIVADYIQEISDDGITVIFASGNEHCNLDENFYEGSDGYPRCSQNAGIQIRDESELPSVIGVSASDERNDVASYPNYGSNIDILAPGGDSHTNIGLLGLTNSTPNNRGFQRSNISNDYSFTNGTSFAAPITAGVAALMLSINPSLTPKQVREIMISTTDKIGSYSNYDINGFDKYRAYGKINATRAVETARDY